MNTILKIDGFDAIHPPTLTQEGEELVLVFKQLPPSNRPENPLYNRLEIILNNNFGYQYKIRKSKDNLKYTISPYNRSVIDTIISVLPELHTKPVYTRYNGNSNFVKAKKVTEWIKKYLSLHLKDYDLMLRYGKKAIVKFSNCDLEIHWGFFYGDASKEFSFRYSVTSKKLIACYNKCIANTEFEPVKSIELLREHQQYDHLEGIPYSFDVANETEVQQCVALYCDHLKKTLLTNINIHEDLLSVYNKIRYNLKHSLYRFPDREYIKLLILQYHLSPRELEEEYRMILATHSVENENELKKMKYFINHTCT